MNLLYGAKKLLLTPRTFYRRRRHVDETPFMKAALELHYYRQPFYDYIDAYVANPDILHDAPLTGDSVVLDVGAYDGQWSRRLFDMHGSRIIAFEPNPDNYARLEKRAGGDWCNLEYGLAGSTGAVNFSLRGMGSSAYDESAGQHERVAVNMKAVDEAWRELGLGRVALMKINIEGGEYPLLERMIAMDMLSEVDTFLVQFHEWHRGAYSRRRRIRRELARTHRLVWDYPFVWEKWQRLAAPQEERGRPR